MGASSTNVAQSPNFYAKLPQFFYIYLSTWSKFHFVSLLAPSHSQILERIWQGNLESIHRQGSALIREINDLDND
jgi:hypothetical protein